MNSFQFRFRPNLESMGERIVPDAAPIAAPIPAAGPPEVAPPPRVVPPDSGSDEALRERIAVIDKKVTDLINQDAALKGQYDALRAAYDQDLQNGNFAAAAAKLKLMLDIEAKRQEIARKIDFYLKEKAELVKWLERPAVLASADFTSANTAVSQ